jgi:hypothetical protein
MSNLTHGPACAPRASARWRARALECALRARRPRLLALIVLLMAACGDDGAGAPDAGSEPAAKGPLADGIVGERCTPGFQACGPRGQCATQLTGGAAFELLVDPLPAPDGYCTATCSRHSTCGDEGVCFGRGLLEAGGECRKSCDENADCEPGQECAKAEPASPLLPNTCQPLPTPAQLRPDEAGKLCSKDDDCGEGLCAERGHSYGGYCTGLCIFDADCGRGGTCVRGPYGSSGICAEACQKDSDCQRDDTGWGCGRDGQCVREANPVSSVGAACEKNDDCGGGTCRVIGLTGERYPDGYCVGRCDEDSDCGEHGVCINGLTCLRACTSSQQCRPEYACRAHPQAIGDDTDVTVCYPKSTSNARD